MVFSNVTVIIVAILFLCIGFIFGTALGIFLGIEIKTLRDKKRRS